MRFVPLACDTNTDSLKEPSSTTLLKKNKLKIAYLGDYNSKIRNIIPLYNVGFHRRIHHVKAAQGRAEHRIGDFHDACDFHSHGIGRRFRLSG